MPPSDMFDNFEEQGQSLIGSLHLDAEDEPTRRGAASRANSVRFDESALQGSSWAQNGRPSNDFGPIRPGSVLGNHGMMERSLSHKSDGRHSSAGHSVHSVHSHHSVASGRGSSLGLDTTYTPGGHDEDASPVGIPEPPPSFFVLGSVPSIIRCWLTANFAHDTLLYANICTGSQRSVLEYSLIKELDLVEDIHRDLDGVHRIRLPVYLTEATKSHASSRNTTPAPQMPSVMATFEVVGMDQPENPECKKGIRIFIGSETLREHSTDVLFSQNRLTLYSSDREKLSIPFVRPEDNGIFKHIRTMVVLPEKPKLNATARPFVLGEPKAQSVPASVNGTVQVKEAQSEQDTQGLDTPSSETLNKSAVSNIDPTGNQSESGGESEHRDKNRDTGGSDSSVKDQEQGDSHSVDNSGETTRRISSAAGSIWHSWRQGTAPNGTGDQKDNASPLSGYQPAGARGARNMKVLKPMRSSVSSSSARTGAAYEPPPSAKSIGGSGSGGGGGEARRKSQGGPETSSTAGGSTSSNTIRWESSKRAVSISAESAKTSPAIAATATASARNEVRSTPSTPRTSANPVGGASAFSWMNPQQSAKSRTPAAVGE